MNQEKTLEELQSCIERNINNILDENPSKIDKIKIGDIFIYNECDEEGFYQGYFVLKENEGFLYLIECDKHGKSEEIDFSEYDSLEYYIEKNALFQLIKDLEIYPLIK